MKKIHIYHLLIGIALLCSFRAKAQQIMIDQGILAGELWCFPRLNDTLSYYYMPNEAKLALDEKSLPQFSFLRYTDIAEHNPNSPNIVTKAGGGAVLTFLVTYETPKEKVVAAESELQKLTDNDSIRLKGPIIFEEGRYSLISSVLNPDNGKKRPHILASGSAPVLEGSKIAFSFEMTPRNSKILLESFKTNTPDISVMFDMTFRGVSEAYNAELTVDWSKVKESMSMKAKGNIYFVSADVEKSMNNLIQNNAVRLETVGSDAKTEGLLNVVYDRLMNLLFEPLKPEEVPEDKRGGLADALESLFDKEGILSSKNTSRFGLHAGYQLKEMKSEGSSRMSFNSRNSVTRHHFIAFNIGDLYKKYGENENFFKTVSLDDPDFTQREIRVGIDGSLDKEFNKFINSVAVVLRKKHQNGEETLKEVIVNKNASKNTKTPPILIYGSKKDTSRTKWLDYDFKAVWNFKRGGTYETDWTAQSSAMINLFPPYERREIQLFGDYQKLKENDIRVIVVRLTYDFFNKKKIIQKVIPIKENSGTEIIEITQPLNQYDYDWSVTKIKQNGEKISSDGKNNNGVIFLDEFN